MESHELLERMVSMHQEVLEKFEEVKQDNLEVRKALQELETKLLDQASVTPMTVSKTTHGATNGVTDKKVTSGDGLRRGEESRRTSQQMDLRSPDTRPVSSKPPSLDKEPNGKPVKRRMAKEFLDEGIRQSFEQRKNNTKLEPGDGG